jgi:hypothetical protein
MTFSYTRSTWATNDTITAAKLNNIETGVVAASQQTGGGTASNVSVDITAAPYSADKTGASDMLPALRTAVAAVAALGGGKVVFPAGTYKAVFADQSGSNPDSSLTIPAGVVLEGVGPASVLSVNCSNGTGTGFLFALKFAGTAPGIRNIRIQRGNVYDGVLLTWATSDRAFLENVEFDGKIGTYATNYIHATFLGQGDCTNARWVGGKTHHVTYGLLQPSNLTGLTRKFLADGIEFYGNTATDLEFNAPHSVMENIEVRSCYAHDQDVTAASGGWFFVGFARVKGASVHHNRVENYRGEPVHIEDGSFEIRVHDNLFRACALGSGLSYLQVISYSSNVYIYANRFDAIANSQISGNYPYMIGLQAGGPGGGTTDGGNPFASPYEIDIFDNHFQTQTANGIYVEANARTDIHNNRFKGSGSIDGSGNFVGANAGWGIDFYGGGSVKIVDNYFEGIMYGIRPRQPGETVNTGARPSTITANMFVGCKYGMVITNPERMNITGNIASQCEFPLITGQAAGSSKPISIVGNSAQDCKWPFNYNGKYTIVATGAGSVGSGITLSVAATFVNIPSGVAFVFPGGATFTTTSATTASPSTGTTITGNLTGAAISSGAGGTSAFGAIPHSTTASDNHVLASANLDTVAGVYT